MPNWCYNQITITAPPETLDAIEQNHITKTPNGIQYNGQTWFDYNLEFASIIPLSKTGAQIQHETWGTKWQPESVGFTRADAETEGREQMCIDFDSAWSPPQQIVAKLAALYPDTRITHYYEEAGCDFMGEMVYADGTLVSEHDWHYHPSSYEDPEFEEYEMDYDPNCPVCRTQFPEGKPEREDGEMPFKPEEPSDAHHDPNCPVCQIIAKLQIQGSNS